jgi:hypothetical protein
VRVVLGECEGDCDVFVLLGRACLAGCHNDPSGGGR